MMKQLRLFFNLILLISVTTVSAQNLVPDWDANGATGAGTEANKWGWAASTGGTDWQTANSGGVRYRDLTGIATDTGSAFTGRELLFRWEDSYVSSTLSLGLPNDAGNTTDQDSIILTGGTVYVFKGLFEWINNANAPTYVFAISDTSSGGNIIATKSYSISEKNKFYPFSLLFKPETTGGYYAQVTQTAGLNGSSGGLIGLAELSLEEFTSNDATLSEITLSVGNLTVAFDSATTTYDAEVPLGTNSVDVTAVPTIEFSNVVGDGTIDVSSGTGTANITVTALDGTTKNYTINFQQVASSDATLSGISLDFGYLKGTFDSGTTTYEVLVPAGISTINVVATTNQADATVNSGDGSIDVSGVSPSTVINVTAQNGSTTATYTLNFTVDSSNHTFGWDGDGLTGAGSEPDNFGWQCTVIDSWLPAGSSTPGVRYYNQTYTYQGADLAGRILYVRWDGTGGTSTSSIYSYPARLDTGIYVFTAKIAWHSVGSTPTYTYQINSEPDNSGTTLNKGSLQVTGEGVLNDIKLGVKVETAGTYYFTLKASSGVLGAIRDLNIAVAPTTDTDSDGIIDVFDICPEVANPDQADWDDDGIGDVCEDSDGDGLLDSEDNCPGASNADQKDTDGDGIGDLCDPDLVNVMVPGIDTLTTDGTWCWFQDPRAVYHKGTKEQTITGWITHDGKVQAASYNHETGDITINSLAEGFQIDDHNNPTFLIREDGRIMASYSGHFSGPMRVKVSTNPEDITSWGPEANFGTSVTYANPYQIGDSTVMFFRNGDTWQPTINISMDGGESWGTPARLIKRNQTQQRPYVKYTQDSKGGIHIIFTDGHPRQEKNNKVYYVYFKDSKFYKADGTLIKEFTGSNPLDIDGGEPEVVYDASNGKGWTWDLTVDENDNPVALYAAFPDDQNHHYYYAHWDGTQWNNHHIVNSGRWFPQTPEGGTEPEPNYSGGMAVDPEDPSIVYVSKQVNGVFEIYKYTTTDFGATWSEEPITQNTEPGMINVRPVIPRGHKKGEMEVLWMRGSYITYNNYHTSVMYYSPGPANSALSAIFVDGGSLDSFHSDTLEYTIELPAGTTAVPTVTAVAAWEGAEVAVTDASALPGATTVTVTSKDGSTVTTYTINFTLEPETLSADVNKTTVGMYPNPVVSELTVDLRGFQSSASTLVQVLDINGRVLFDKDLRNTEMLTIDVGQFEQGLYILRVTSGEKSFTSNFVKIK